MVMIFKDRKHAGELLGKKLREHLQSDTENVALLALPAGGVPVGYEVARSLGVSLDVAVVRKILVPWNTEAGYGAVSWTGRQILNHQLIGQLALSHKQILADIDQAKRTVAERLRKFRGDRPPLDLAGRSVVIIDDGLASGFTMLVAVESVRAEKPTSVIVGVPTGSQGAVELVAAKADIVVCLNIREGPVFAVADAYEHWYDLTDEEVVGFLERVSAGRS